MVKLYRGFCTSTTKTPYTLVWFSNDFCLIFTLYNFVGRMTQIEDRFWIETDSFVHCSKPNIQHMTLNELVSHMSMLHIHKSHITLVSHVWKSFIMLKLFVVNQNLFMQYNIPTF